MGLELGKAIIEQFLLAILSKVITILKWVCLDKLFVIFCPF